MSTWTSPLLKVTAVEDNPDDMDFLCRRLAKVPGIEVVGCHATGEEALRQIPKAAPALVFMDILLPGISGIECTRRLKLKRGLARLRVVMVTSVHDKATFGDALRNGADGYLTKPVSQGELETSIVKALAGSPPISDTMMALLVELARQTPATFTALPGLTKRENEILRLLLRGYSDKKLAALAGVSRTTIHTHLHHIFRKLGVTSRAEAVARCNGK